MFRKIVSSLVCLSFLAAPTAPSYAEQYIFRHKYPLGSEMRVPPAGIDVGNDIVAYYTAPVGKPFEKRIPVKTTDVADWRVVSGSTASGIDLDQNDGVYEGTPDVPQVEMQTLEGYDAANNLIAKAEVHFKVIKPEGVEVEVSFFAHTNQYSYNVIPSPPGVDVENWVALMTLAPGMGMRNEALEGNPAAAGVYTLLWQGYDYLGKPVAYAWGDFTVTDGPVVAKVPDMSIDPGRGQSFNYTPTVTNALGSVSWKLQNVDGYRPPELTFKSIDGNIGGQVTEFGMSKQFQLVVTDAYDGTSTSSNVFKLSTAQANFSMSEVPDRQLTLNEFASFGFYTTTNIKDLVWSLDPTSGPLPTGMGVNPENGRVEGTPKELGEFPGIIVRVDGIGGFNEQTNAFKITVFDKDIRLSTTPLVTRIGKQFQTEGVKIGVGRVDPVDHSFLAGYVPLRDIQIASDNGKISSAAGFPEATAFNVPITVKNGDGQPSRNVGQYIGVYPEIDLSYEDFEFTRFGYTETLGPTVDQNTLVGDVEYTITPSLPSWLKMDRYGRIRLDYNNPAPKGEVGFEGTFTVSVTDAQGVPVPSNPFEISLKDRAALKLEEQNGGSHQVERYVSYALYNPYYFAKAKNFINGVTYRLTSSSQPLPEGLVLAPGGYLERRTSVPVGDYAGIEIVAKDGDGSSDTYGPFTLKVVADTGLKWPEGELAAELTWAEGRPFTLQLPKPYNAKEPLTYSIKSGPSGLSIDDKGVLSGQVNTDGTYTVEYEIDDDTSRVPITGTVQLTIEEPFTFGPAAWDAYKGTEATFTVPVERGIKPITYLLLNPQDMPKTDWRHYSGTVRGTATSATGGFPVSIRVTDKAGVSKQFSTFVNFKPSLPLNVTWSGTPLYVGEASGLPKTPVLSAKPVAIPSWAISGTLPDGIGFDSTSGVFFANPAPGSNSAGIYQVDVTPSPTDPDVSLLKPYFPVTLKVGYSGDINFPGKTFKHRVNKAIEQPLSYSRAVAPVKFTAINVGSGVTFNAAEGKFSASFAEPGSFSAGNIKIEENDDPAFNREKTSSFGFQIYPDLVVTVPAAMTYSQYDWKSGTPAVTENVIGDGDATTPDVSYALAEGYSDLPQGLTVNASTGAVEGTPEVFGEFGPFAIAALDAYGDSKNSNEFSVTIAERKQMTLSYSASALAFHRFDKTSAAPTVLDGYGPFSWSISPPPPAGIEFDNATGVLTARTTDIIPEAAYRVTIVDRKGGVKGTAYADIAFGVAERPQLTATYPVTEQIFKRHNADTGIVASAKNRVSMGGSLEYAITPALPSCIAFDPASGRISADCSTEIQPTEYTVTVTDDTYRTQGSAFGRHVMPPIKVSVGPRDPITLSYEGYDKIGQTFGFIQHQTGSATPTFDGNLTDEVTWSISPALPAVTDPLSEGLSFDYATGTIHASSSVPITPSAYVVTIKDDKDGETRLSLMIGVDKRKDLAFTTNTTQEIVLNSDYELTLEVENVLGDIVRYELVSGTLPVWLRFDADGSGACGFAATFCGTPDVSDHGKTFAFDLRATDDFDGDTGTVTFEFTVVEDATPMTLVYDEPAKARVGYPYKGGVGTVEHAVGNYTFSAPALSHYGLSIDPKTGVVSGTPNSTFDVTVSVTVTDKLGASRAASADIHLVSVPSPRVEVSNPTNGEFNRAITADEQPSALDVEGDQAWTVSPDALPTGLTLDPLTGQLLGTPQQLGTFGPYTLTLVDSLPGAFPSAPFMFDIVMNKDPIELEELSVLTKVGFPFETKAPDYENNYGAAVFSSPELAALGLTVDRTTGVVSGSLASAMDVRPNLVIRDTTTRTTSMPVGIKVLPRMRLTAPETVTLTALDKIVTPIAVTRTYVAGSAVWSPVDPTLLPEGVTFNTATGAFVGTPTRVQTLDPMTVSATDTFGAGQTDTQNSNPITFVVKKGPFYMEFNPGDLPIATKRSAYSFDLVANDMFDFEGMDMSEITFKIESIDNSRTPEQMEALLGLKVVNGVLTGTPADEGEFNFYVSATFSNRAPVKGLFHLKMVLPETTLELTETNLSDANQFEAWTFDFKTVLDHDNIPLSSIVWGPLVAMPNSQQVTALPPDMIFANGVLSGKPMTSGEYVFKVSVAFTDRSEVLSYDMVYSLSIKGVTYKFKQIALGGYGHACGVTEAGGVLCWGDNRYSQVAGGLTASVLKASEVPTLYEGVKSVSLGYYSSCALMTNNTVKCWGNNGGPNYQLLATGSKAENVFPPEPVTLAGIAQQSRGFSTSCFALTGGSVRCSTGNGSTSVVTGLTNVAEIVSGYSHQCVRMASGEVRCWGAGGDGQLGNGATTTSNTPVVATGVANAVQVSAMNNFTCALTQAGAVMCWGADFTPTPAVVPGLESGVSRITTGHAAQNLCVIMQDGGVKCKGAGTAGQLGNGANKTSNTFVNVVGLEAPAISLSTSLQSSCAVVTTGKAYCWGSGGAGRLGVGDTATRNVATPVVLP